MSCREIAVCDTVCQSSGECLLRLGALARYLLRHGCGLSQVARELGVSVKVCVFAIAFLTAPDWLKFRALVENWNLLSIRSRLRAFGHAPALTFRI